MCRLLHSATWVVSLVLLLASCSGAAPDREPTLVLRLGGSSSLAPAMAALASGFQADHPNIVVDVQPSDSEAGLEELLAGDLDIAGVSWQPANQQTPDGIAAISLARDAVAVIVHPDNAVPGLTMLQLRALYRGEILEWAALRGTGGEPIIISREDGSGTRAAFEALVMGGDRVTLNALILPHSSAVVDYVASHRAAVGYVSVSALTAAVRALPIEEVLPEAETIREGSYHLSRLLFLCAADPAAPYVDAFLSYASGPDGQAVVGRYHVPLR